MSIRITGGEFKGRLIESPKGDKVRPTSSQTRQALFNSLQALIDRGSETLYHLDLFSGAGTLAFEGLSRGFTHALCVDQDRLNSTLIKRNAEILKVLPQVQIETKSVESLPAWLGERDFIERFDLITADPPYAKDYEDWILGEAFLAERWLKPSGILVVEWGVQKSKKYAELGELPSQVRSLEKIREKNYGDTTLSTYIKRA